MDRSYDVVVVGAGSAGCVLAARLSQDPTCKVALIEAGPDYETRGAFRRCILPRVGPAPVRRYCSDEMSVMSWASLEAAKTAEHLSVEDHNKPGAADVRPLPQT